MHDQSPALLWLMRSAFILLALFVLIFQILPLDTSPRSWAGPDLLLGFAIAWSLRRPEFVPALALAGVFLLADLLLQRPPGLWALLALIGCEQLKHRGRSLRAASFVAEWIAVAITLTCIVMAYHILSVMFLLPPPPVPLSATLLFFSILAYPAIVAVTHGVMRVQKVTPGDLDAFGQRA